MDRYSNARNDIAEVGRLTWELGLNSLRSGNISIILPKRVILITKTHKSLRDLDPRTDLTTVPELQTDRGEASSEFYVHRAIYQAARCERGAILHCHPPLSIALSWILDGYIPPSYNEAKDVLGKTVILNSSDRESLGEDPANIGSALRMNKIVTVRGHGTFTLAESLEHCLYLTHLLESSCRVLFLRAVAVEVANLGRSHFG